MNRFLRMVMFAMMIAGLIGPTMATTASAQDASLCDAADGVAAGTKIQGYTVVYGNGGSGSQIVLGYGSAYLSGGSGNDILCAWGGGNTLDGGSGNDVLIVMSGAGNTLLGGSGNDTLIGFVGDVFDGGTGRNEQVQRQQLDIRVDRFIDDNRGFIVLGSGFTPGASVGLIVDYYDIGDQWISSDSTRTTILPIADSNGNFSTMSE